MTTLRQIATRLVVLAALARAKDEKIVILNEVKNLVLPHLTLMNSLARSFGALRMTRFSQIATRLTSLAVLTMNEDEKIVILNEVKNLVFTHLTLMDTLARSFGALRMTTLTQLVVCLVALA